MARNRVIYQSKAVYAGPDKGTDNAYGNESGATQPTQLKRVQSANYGFDIARTDVNQFGELASIDRVVLDTPTVSLDFSYLLANFTNEDSLGFYVNPKTNATSSLVSALSGVLNKTSDERNFFIQNMDKCLGKIFIRKIPFS